MIALADGWLQRGCLEARAANFCTLAARRLFRKRSYAQSWEQAGDNLQLIAESRDRIERLLMAVDEAVG